MISKLNIFNKNAAYYPLRWFVVCCLSAVIFMYYADTVGWRFLSFNNQEKWSAAGSGSHK
jgi:hypothetical protein